MYGNMSTAWKSRELRKGVQGDQGMVWGLHQGLGKYMKLHSHCIQACFARQQGTPQAQRSQDR